MNTFVREHGNLIREFLRAIDEGEALLDVNEPYVALVLQGMIRALITLPPHYTSAINEVLREFDGLAASMIFPLEDDTFKGVFVDGKWYREPEETRYPIASNAPLSKELEWEIDRLSGQIHSEMSGVAIGRKESATRALLEGAALRLMREPDMAYEDFVDVLTELKHQGLLLVAHEVGCTYDSETQSWEYPKDRTDHTGIKTQEILHGMRPDLFDAPVYPDSGPSFGRDFS